MKIWTDQGVICWKSRQTRHELYWSIKVTRSDVDQEGLQCYGNKW